MANSTDLASRFFARVEFGGSRHAGTRCLEWTGGRTETGYGLFSRGSRRSHVPAHRWLYERWTGENIDGLQLHHLCHNKGCVNPDHLESLTVSEHARRHGEERGEITHCPVGHEYDEANTYVHPTRGYRCCRACHRERERQRKLAGKTKPHPKRGPIPGRECVVCGSELDPMSRMDAKFCSPACRSTAGTRAARAKAA